MNWMSPSILVPAIFAAVFLTILALRLRGYREPAGASGENEFSPARYEPMLRLLSSEDVDFLATQPGYRPEIGARLRGERRQIFRMYLRELASDFHRLHRAARERVTQAPQHSSDLVGALLWQEVTFWRAVLMIELRLMIPALGGIDVRGLVDAIDAMRADATRMPAADAV